MTTFNFDSLKIYAGEFFTVRVAVDVELELGRGRRNGLVVQENWRRDRLLLRWR